MRSEHPTTGDETDAFSRFGRRYLSWRPGKRKAIKRQSHKKDRQVGKRMTVLDVLEDRWDDN